MPLMISDTPLFVAYNGPSARFDAGVERFVRDSLVDVAVANGARLVGEPAKATPAAVSVDDADIQAAIWSLTEAGNDRAFGTDGKPKVRSIEKVLGANIDAADRDRVWDAMNAD